MKMIDKELYTLAYGRAAQEHRDHGGTGAPADALIDKHVAELRYEMDADETATASTATKPVPAPTLAESRPRQEYRTIRDLNGNEHRVFSNSQKLSDTYETRADGLTLEGMGAALAGIASGNMSNVRAEVRALSEGVGSAGGFLVPDELSAQLVDLARSKSVIFQAGCGTVQMNSDKLSIVRLTTDPVVTENIAEGVAITESAPAFDRVSLYPKKLGCLVSATNELLEDGMNAGQAIIDSLSASMAAAIDSYVLDKIFDWSEIGTESSVGSINFNDLLKAMLDVRLLNGEGDTLICNPNLPYDLSLLTESTTGAYLAPPAQLAGLRFLETTACAETHALFGDFTKAIAGIRRGLTIDLSREAGSAFEKDITYIRATTRLDSAVLVPHFRILADIS